MIGLICPRELQQLLRLEQPVDHGAEELLLPSDPVEVRRGAVAPQVAGAHVRQRLDPVERLAPGLDVKCRERVVDVAVRGVDVLRVDAHLHAAERVDHALEAGEIHVEHVVDLEAR